MIFFLIVGFLFELLLAILFSKGDFFRPSVIVSGIMFAASVCSAYLAPIWKFELQDFTVIILLASVVLIIVFDYLTTLFYIPNNKTKITLEYIDVSSLILVIIICFCIFSIIWHYKYLVSAVGNMSSLSIMITRYRNMVVWGTLQTKMPSLLSRVSRLSFNFAYLSIYIFINNFIVTKSFKRNVKFLIPVILFSIESVLWGARGYIMYLIFATVIYAYVLSQRDSGWKYKLGLKYISRIVLTLSVIAILFVISGNFVGRSSYGSLFYKIALYFGGGIALLNDFFESGGIHSRGFGAATFVTMNSFLSRRFGRTDFSEYTQFEFRSHGDYNWGNVYTAIRRYYQDFGIIGVLIFVTIFAVFFGVYYTSIKKNKYSRKVDGALLFYGVMIRAQFLFFYDDELFSDFFTPSIIVTLIELFICVFFMTRFKIIDNGLKIIIPKLKYRRSIVKKRFAKLN